MSKPRAPLGFWVPLVSFVATGLANASGWPRFRGPTGDGISEETDAPFHSRARGRPAVSEGQIFLRPDRAVYCVGSR